MNIIADNISRKELSAIAAKLFGDMVKAVVDVEKQSIAIDAELHSDLEALLLESGSRQEDLWGINLYPELQGDGLIEFDAMINMKPSQGNRSRGVDNEKIRSSIVDIVNKTVTS